MGRKLLSGVVLAVFGMTTVVAARAQTISIGAGPAGSVTTIATDATPGAPGILPIVEVVNSSTFGEPVLATAQDWTLGDDLGSTISASPFGAEPGVIISLWVTETDIDLGSTPQRLSFVSGFAQNRLPAGATVTETTWFDAGDTAYGTRTQLATDRLTSIGSKSVTSVIDAVALYSITEEYDVTYSNPEPPTALSTISLTTTDGSIPVVPVPEPPTWAMMLLGFAGLGYAGYRETKRARFQPA
jgi:hypothetical protein